MRKSTALVVIAVLFALAIFSQREDRQSAAQDAPSPVQKWEYQIYQVQPSEISTAQHGNGLNAKGKEGWEFCQAVSVEPIPTSIILKRPLR